jgi:DNA-binding transcriptional regulator LsrR (DeoR family)
MFEEQLEKMEQAILNNLSSLEYGYGKRKKSISKETGIPEDILTVLLKRLKYKGKVELIMIWCEHEGTPNGSGYRLTINK